MKRDIRNSKKSASKKGKPAKASKAAKKAAPKKAAKKAVKKAVKRATRNIPAKAIKKGAEKAAKKGNFAIAKKATNMLTESRFIEVNDAAFVKDNVLLISFSDGVKKEVDFGTFFKKNNIPYLNKYKQETNFRKFKIEDGNVVWGKDWDLIFPIEQLYNGVIK